MNYFKILLVLFILTMNFSICLADSALSNKNSTLKWTPKSAGEISTKANQNSSYEMMSPMGGIQDPFMQGALNGYYNTMQGMSGASLPCQELQKQQMDYAKQQAEYAKQMDNDD